MRVRQSLVALFCAVASATLALGAASIAAHAQSALGAQAAIIKTDGSILLSGYSYEAPASFDAGIPFGTVILIPQGNSGLLDLDANNNITGPNGNFTVRSANEFLRRGLHVMIPDVLPAYASGMTTADRFSATYAGHLQTFINAAKARWQLPVWVVGQGGSSVSVMTAGGFAPALTGYAGLIMTTPVTAGFGAGNQTLFDTYKARITAPTFIGWHTNTTCSGTPPAGAQALYTAIPATDKVQAAFTGGHSVASDPCNGIGEQSFAGIEGTVVDAMVAFMKARSGLVAIPNQAAPAPTAPPLPAPAPMAWSTTTKR